MFNSYSLFDDFFSYNRRPSVFVVSDSQLAEWKQQQALKEVEQLDRLIAGHKLSIESLEKTKRQILPESLESNNLQSLDSPESSDDPSD